jgi:hypothetical protein
MNQCKITGELDSDEDNLRTKIVNMIESFDNLNKYE